PGNLPDVLGATRVRRRLAAGRAGPGQIVLPLIVTPVNVTLSAFAIRFAPLDTELNALLLTATLVTREADRPSTSTAYCPAPCTVRPSTVMLRTVGLTVGPGSPEP